MVLEAYTAAERANAVARYDENAIAAGRSTSEARFPMQSSTAFENVGVAARKAVDELLRFLGREGNSEEFKGGDDVTDLPDGSRC